MVYYSNMNETLEHVMHINMFTKLRIHMNCTWDSKNHSFRYKNVTSNIRGKYFITLYTFSLKTGTRKITGYLYYLLNMVLTWNVWYFVNKTNLYSCIPVFHISIVKCMQEKYHSGDGTFSLFVFRKERYE